MSTVPNETILSLPLGSNTAATEPEHYVRLAEAQTLISSGVNGAIQFVEVASTANPSTEMAALTGEAGSLIIVHKTEANKPDNFTIYMIDDSATGYVEAPYVIAIGGGKHAVALGGRYSYYGTTFNTRAGGALAASADTDYVRRGEWMTGKGYYAQARQTVAQSVASETQTVIVFDTQISDVVNGAAGDSYNPTTGVFTTPRAGVYMVSAKICFAPSDAGARAIGIYLDDTIYLGTPANEPPPSASLPNHQFISIPVIATAANQTITIKGFQSSGDALLTAVALEGEKSWLSIVLI